MLAIGIVGLNSKIMADRSRQSAGVQVQIRDRRLRCAAVAVTNFITRLAASILAAACVRRSMASMIFQARDVSEMRVLMGAQARS